MFRSSKRRHRCDGIFTGLRPRRTVVVTSPGYLTRDGLKGILNSYDSELLHSADHSPQLIARLEEAEDTVQKVEAHTAEMEIYRFPIV
ncbi:UNVERIFIED_CONTAM: hypothetical protein K2H54_022891 [Gekko kuhli]